MTNSNLIIGAGGHGKVIANGMLEIGLNILGFVDDNPQIIGCTILGLPVLGTIDNLADFGPDGLVAGIGHNSVRQQVVQRVNRIMCATWLNVVHPKAVVSDFVKMGSGSVVMAGGIINADTNVGDHVIINTGSTVDHDCRIGDFVHIAPGAHIAGGVTVGEGALLGIGCSVIPGCQIGEWAVIGAGTIVVDNVPAGVTAKGVPARWGA